HRLVIRSLQARFRDGTLVSVPEDAALPALDLKQLMATENALTINLAVPMLRLGRANVSSDGVPEGGGRYIVDSQDLEDENTGVNPQPIHVRLLNLKLLLSNQDMTGYETIPIARIEKSQQAEAVPQLDLSYFPPVVACDGWLPLQNEILQAVYDRIGKKIEVLASQVVTRGIDLEGHARGGPL